MFCADKPPVLFICVLFTSVVGVLHEKLKSFKVLDGCVRFGRQSVLPGSPFGCPEHM